MSKTEDARKILNALRVQPEYQTDMCCYVLLALAGIKTNTEWKFASNEWLRIHDIIVFVREHYGVAYAENSRETIRKQAIHNFRNAAFIEDNGKATNSPNYSYRLTSEMLTLVRCYNGQEWRDVLQTFLAGHESLMSMYSSKRFLNAVPIRINSQQINFSGGEHNKLQKAVIEEFAPRFAQGAECLYIGDSSDRDLLNDTAKLLELGFEITAHDKMPDIILYSHDKERIYFIEAVISTGAMTPKRIQEIESITVQTSAEKIYITAFPDFKTFKKFAESIAWETEIWLADVPNHMIHFNDDKFI